MLDFIKNIGPTEIVIVAVILLLLFGSKIITGFAKTSGETIKEIKNAKKEFIKATQEDSKSSKD